MAFNFAQRFSVVAATVALATLVPGIAFSQPAAPTSRPNQQPANSSSNNGRSIRELLNLSADQVAKINTILNDRQQKIESLLTTEQKNAFTQAIQSGQSSQVAFQAMNLSQDQVNQIQSISVNSSTEIQKVLTPQQLQQLEQLRQMPNPNQAQPGNQQRRNQGSQR